MFCFFILEKSVIRKGGVSEVFEKGVKLIIKLGFATVF